jgi:hypothetical protein
MQLEQLQEVLKNAFDSVSETRDGTYVARGQSAHTTRAEGSADVEQRLRTALPQASIVASGGVQSKGRFIQWYVEFTI